jgi:pimeloyl-ACP methyl ester carboxylesterase
MPTTPAAPEHLRDGTWVLLRGLMREHGHWGDFPRQLAAATQARQVLTPDLPGNGTLHTQTSPTRIADMVDACRAQVREALGADAGPVHVLSISMGGMLATAWAQSHPHELASLSLMASSMRPFSPLWQRLRPRHWPRILGLIASGASDDAWEQAILQMTTRSPQAAHALPQWLAIRQRRPVHTLNALRQLLAAARFQAPVQAPAVPTLVMCGQQDDLVDPRCSQAIAQAWQCTLRMHPTAGHDLPLDAPQWVIDTLLDTLGNGGPTNLVPTNQKPPGRTRQTGG